MDKKLKDTSQRIKDLLLENQLHIEVIEFKELIRTSKETAATIGCELGQIAKTLIYKGKKSLGPICVIVSGKNRIDEKKIAQHVGEEIEKPDAHFVVEHTKFAIGGVPPIGFSFEIKPLIDQDLMDYPVLWAAAGTPYAVFKISPQDLVKMTEGRVVKLRK